MYFKQTIVRPADLAEVLGVSIVTLWNWRRSGVLPEPLSLGPRFIGWPCEVLNEWIDEQQGGVE